MEVNTTSFIKILAVIPVYNHGATLKDVTIKTMGTGFDVLVVDDGSTDQGLESLQGIGCLTHTLSPNQGERSGNSCRSRDSCRGRL